VNSHIYDHKDFFSPPVLQPKHTSIAYLTDGQSHYNATFTIPPNLVIFPAEVQTYEVQNHHWIYNKNWECGFQQLHQRIFPYGDFEISLLNIRPPSHPQEICKRLPDPENPQLSYALLAHEIRNNIPIDYHYATKNFLCRGWDVFWIIFGR